MPADMSPVVIMVYTISILHTHPNFGAKPVAETVGESRRGVVVHIGRVYP